MLWCKKINSLFDDIEVRAVWDDLSRAPSFNINLICCGLVEMSARILYNYLDAKQLNHVIVFVFVGYCCFITLFELR